MCLLCLCPQTPLMAIKWLPQLQSSHPVAERGHLSLAMCLFLGVLPPIFPLYLTSQHCDTWPCPGKSQARAIQDFHIFFVAGDGTALTRSTWLLGGEWLQELNHSIIWERTGRGEWILGRQITGSAAEVSETKWEHNTHPLLCHNTYQLCFVITWVRT